jgi:hypothetical protein
LALANFLPCIVDSSIWQYLQAFYSRVCSIQDHSLQHKH